MQRSIPAAKPQVLSVGRRAQLLGGAALALALAGQAHAQAAATPPTPTDSAAVEEVTVTASRVDRTGYTAPTPTTVVTSEQLEAQGATNIMAVLNEVPAFKADTTPATNGIRAATPGASNADLRGLGALRTLVLVDGLRFVPQVPTVVDSYQVDLNQIPEILIDRTEVVTGGASAQWGSDALAGVVNIILKKNFEGFQAEAQGGQSTYGDDSEKRFAILAGKSFFGGKGHFEIALDYDRDGGVGSSYTRPWGKTGTQLAGNPCSVLATAAQIISNACPGGVNNGLAQNLILPNVQYGNIAPGGVITNTILKGTTFGTGGSPMPFTFGQYAAAGSTMVGGSNTGDNINTGVSLEDWVHRFTTYVRAAYDISPTTTAYMEGTFSQTSGGGQTLPGRDTVTIFSGNPYIPASIQTLMTANGIASFTLGRDNADFGRQQSRQDNYTTRIVAGLNGSFGGWKWDAADDFGYNIYHLHDAHDILTGVGNQLQQASNAVLNPATGQVVCASSLTSPGNGCVPIDLFGVGSPSTAAINYVTGTTWQKTDYGQHDITANIHGEPFGTWAGPISVAAGFEYRNEWEDSTVDPRANLLQYEGTNSRPIAGSFNTKEGYFEAVVPLLSDKPFAKSLDFNGAIRVVDYSTKAGVQEPWKAGLTWTPMGGLLFRMAESHDIRGPNIYELDSLPLTVTTNISINGKVAPIAQNAAGNPSLQPETSNTFTLGGSYAPEFVRGLQFSLDYYRIVVTNMIAQQTAQALATYCGTGNAAQQAYYCSLITFSTPGDKTSTPLAVYVPYQNLQENIRSGFDMSASYTTPLSRFAPSLPGSVALAFSGNYIAHYLINAGTGNVERAGDMTGSPRFRSTSSVSYHVGPLSVMAQVRYVNQARYDNTYVQGVNINNNVVPAKTYVDFSGSYDVNSHLQFFGVVRNAFNVAPPFVPTAFGYPTNPTFYDTIGETFRVGLRVKY